MVLTLKIRIHHEGTKSTKINRRCVFVLVVVLVVVLRPRFDDDDEHENDDDDFQYLNYS
jgi:hypothetical protein